MTFKVRGKGNQSDKVVRKIKELPFDIPTAGTQL